MWNILTFVERINGFLVKILGVIVLFIMLTGVYEVAMRYLFNHPTSWVWELNGFLLTVIVSLAGGYVLMKKSHVRVDVIYQAFSTRTKAIIDVVTFAFTLLFLGVLLWQTSIMGFQSLQFFEHSQTDFRPPIYPFKIIMCIGVFLFLMQAVLDFVRNLKIAVKGEGSTDHGT
ncbi:MAG: TRAP transporter small permease subunit [Deltaproteobacteria bacterium]|nr:TRAP transporter small permease subunit [Deltaproteobacteria bacterium]